MYGVRLSVLGLWMIVFASHALAFRCAGKIISEQSQRDEVRQWCGDPFSVRRYWDYRIVAIQQGHARRSALQWITIAVHIEEWIYNFGPNNLQRKLHFENGALTRIATLGYGY